MPLGPAVTEQAFSTSHAHTHEICEENECDAMRCDGGSAGTWIAIAAIETRLAVLSRRASVAVHTILPRWPLGAGLAPHTALTIDAVLARSSRRALLSVFAMFAFLTTSSRQPVLSIRAGPAALALPTVGSGLADRSLRSGVSLRTKRS